VAICHWLIWRRRWGSFGEFHEQNCCCWCGSGGIFPNLMGEMELERLFLRPAQFYADAGIDLRLNTKVDSIDPSARTLTLGSETLSYDKLALTTGSDPIRLPAAIGGTLKGVFTVRDLADIDAMAPYCVAGKRVLIVGGGYIGLEAAAVCASRGLEVVLVEMADRILQRVASKATSDYFRALHQSHGVDIRESTGLETLLGEDHVSSARLSDGSALEIDFAVIGIGIRPATGLAEAAGLKIDNGIAVDGLGQTSDAHIYAAGDCTSFPYKGERLRLESVPNAIDQAEATAAAMLGGTDDYVAKPWFWSDQYDAKLQIAGLNTGFDATYLRPGERDGAQSIWYYKGRELLAVDAMNDPRAYMVAKRLIEAGRSADSARVVDPATDLKALLK